MAVNAGAARRPGRRRTMVVAVLVAAVLAGAAAAVAASGVFAGGSRGRGTGESPYHTSTAAVTRRSLSSQTQVNATLGYAGSYTVAGRGGGGGVLTWLPAAGRVIRQGQVLYRVDNGTPVFLLYGAVPAWRALSEGMSGADVAQLNRDLVALGYVTPPQLGPRSAWDYFSAVTTYALERLQAHLGLMATGMLPLGQVVFLASALRVTIVNASPGAPDSGTILTGTSTRRVVTIALSAAQQDDVRAGDRVTITLPDGSTTPGVVSSVGTVAKGSGSSATITVDVTLSNPKAAGHLDQAPVEVAISTGSVSNALVVPVDALLARPGGGYAVEVTGPTGHYLVPVSLGLFDDADGLVQVSGAGLSAGQHVVVPAL